MSGHYKLLQMLRDQGHRMTPQREMVILALHEANDHQTAEAIYECVQSKNPCVDISTVYRTLELLRDMGIVSQSQLGDQQNVYELALRSPHHHLVCKRCNSVIDVSAAEMGSVQKLFSDLYGFEADLDHLMIEGLCADCRETGDTA
ncbi:MAG: Fur family transcriptional regulator [Anaerolineae bacterium]